MAREKVDNKLNVIVGTKAQVEADNTIPDNSIIIVTDEELTASEVGAVAANPDITAGTGTKITYDAKGLVLSSTNLVAGDIPPLAISKVTNLQSSLDNKVDKVTGKGLSTNDYTTAEKNKLTGIAANAEVNRPIATIEQAQLGTDNTTVMTPLGVKTNYYNKDEMDIVIDNLEIDGGFL